MSKQTSPGKSKGSAPHNGIGRRELLLSGTAVMAAAALGAGGQQGAAAAEDAKPVAAASSGKKPNVLVIWGDDIGVWNISHNNRGMMGYQTPNIDRIARKASASRIITASRAAPRAAPPSSAATFPCAPA